MTRKPIEAQSAQSMMPRLKDYEKKYFSSGGIYMIEHITPDALDSVITRGSKYCLEDYRVLRITNGCAKSEINLLPHTLKAGDIVMASKGCILEIIDVSDDVTACGMAFDNPSVFDLNITPGFYGIASLSPTAKEYAETLWKLMQMSRNPEIFTQNIFTAAAKNYVMFAQNQVEIQNTENQGVKKPRNQEIFQKFLALVNQYADKERSIDFYANRLFVSPNYLSAAVKQASGKTVMQWINKQLILKAMILLKHSDKPVAEIAYELNFANPSFFSKFFKKLTGKTPKEYQLPGCG